MRTTLAALLLALVAPAWAGCGEVLDFPTHGNTTTRVALTLPEGKPHALLVLLPGGGGAVNLDADGCPQALTGNSLVRSRAVLQRLGLATALVDAPSDHPGEDGLAGFRTHPDHAADLGQIMAALRKRTTLPIWLAGTSRGSISTANAAARLSGAQAADGVVLTSLLTVGQAAARKNWVIQTVYDLPLEDIRIPVLLVGHAADTCTRSPANQLPLVEARLSNAPRKRSVTLSGGPPWSGNRGLDACEGKSPHGFQGQEQEVAELIVKFIQNNTKETP